jgi:D-sedoheptulose 7-phosphate isomerase
MMTNIKSYVEGLKSCADELVAQSTVLTEIAEILTDAYDEGHRVFVMGNGGSAATASHFARDLKIGVKGLLKLSTECLSDSVAVITSLANDVEYAEVFAEQLRGQVSQDDIVIAISCSGKSENLIRALRVAKFGDNKAKIIGLLGFGGGKMLPMCDKAVVFQSKDYGQVEDIHLAVCHILTNMLRKRIRNE